MRARRARKLLPALYASTETPTADTQGDTRTLLSATQAEWDQPGPLLEALDDPGWNRALAVLLEPTMNPPTSWVLSTHEPPFGDERSWGGRTSQLTHLAALDRAVPERPVVRVNRDPVGVVTSHATRSNLRRETGPRTTISSLEAWVAFS